MHCVLINLKHPQSRNRRPSPTAWDDGTSTNDCAAGAGVSSEQESGHSGSDIGNVPSSTLLSDLDKSEKAATAPAEATIGGSSDVPTPVTLPTLPSERRKGKEAIVAETATATSRSRIGVVVTPPDNPPSPPPYTREGGRQSGRVEGMPSRELIALEHKQEQLLEARKSLAVKKQRLVRFSSDHVKL